MIAIATTRFASLSVNHLTDPEISEVGLMVVVTSVMEGDSEAPSSYPSLVEAES